MTISVQNIITLGSVLAALFAIINYGAKGVRWVDKQERQDEEITAIKAEQKIMVKGILACLRGLQEQGCDGTVTSTINEIEDHINEGAHR